MAEHPLRELLELVSHGLRRFGDGVAAAGAKVGDMFRSLGEQLRRNMCAALGHRAVVRCIAWSQAERNIVSKNYIDERGMTRQRTMPGEDL